ncbi:unnamed protein product [Staurois parvus]|uniref:Uncharacterized protein n=1 Tax=Staurois parvus TaxID=386267 RepID=A0ABN9G6J1_9NEOB|nr:unnamed protein product [Staurois parvus]
MTLALSCDQLCPITADLIGDIYTDQQCPDDQFSPISATCHFPSMSPVSAHQCTSMPHISAYQCTSMPHISAHLSCLSALPISASQCHL